jgi:AcrR family transcriptional regulator
MPATRTHLTRDAKRSEILDAAEAMFLGDGFEGTRVAAIAQRAGVANNAVYWYFPSKDDLLAGVLQRRLERALAEQQEPQTAGFDAQVLGLLARLDEVAILTATVHERAAHSPSVAVVHEAFHRAADELLRGLFRGAGLAEEDAARAAAAVMGLVEGIHLHDPHRDKPARDALVLWTMHRLASAPTPPNA